MGWMIPHRVTASALPAHARIADSALTGDPAGRGDPAGGDDPAGRGDPAGRPYCETGASLPPGPIGVWFSSADYGAVTNW